MPAGRTIAVISLALLFSGCGFSGKDARTDVRRLRMNTMAEPITLDPALQTVVEDQRLSLALFEGLLSYDPRTLRPIPGIAESRETDAGKVHWTFHLREARWSNGDPITASDFVYAWRRVLTPPGTGDHFADPEAPAAIAADYAPLFFAIRGAREFYEKKTADFSTVGVCAADDRTLEVTLARPTPWFEELLCFPTFMPVHRETLERFGAEWTRPEKMVSNGPFRLRERRLGESVTVERNPEYWDARNVGLDEIVYYTTDQIDTALDQYLAGESDWVRAFNPKKVRAWLADPELSRALRAPPYLGTYFYRLNVRRPPFDDVRVRRALALAIDRESITRHLCGLGETPATGLCPPCLADALPWPVANDRGTGFDPGAAKKALADAGFPGGRGFPKIEIAYNSDVRNKAIAEAVQAMWKEHLGIDAGILNREKRVHVAEERAGSYDVSRGSWIGDFADPYTFLEFMTSDSPNNRTGWKNPHYDDLVQRSSTESDEARRFSLLAEAESVLMKEDAALIGIFHYRSVMVLRPGRFTGIYDTIRDLHPPKYIRTANP